MLVSSKGYGRPDTGLTEMGRKDIKTEFLWGNRPLSKPWGRLPDRREVNFEDKRSCFLVNEQRDAQIPFYVFIFIFYSLHVSSTSCSSLGETNFINTTSGICHCVGGRVVCRSEVHFTRHDHRHRVTATRGCIDNLSLLMMSTMCSKHV